MCLPPYNEIDATLEFFKLEQQEQVGLQFRHLWLKTFFATEHP
jgi:hypothetical protein